MDIEISNGINSERVALKLLAEQYARLRLAKGNISLADFELLEKEAKTCEAYSRALNILSFGPNTAKTLKNKLRTRGFDEKAADEAVALLCDKGYLNDNAELEREIEHCLRKLWGSRKISAHLIHRGFSDEATARAGGLLSEIDFSKNCLQLLRQKCASVPKEEKELRKTVASLVRYGYTMSEIKYALSNFGREV